MLERVYAVWFMDYDDQHIVGNLYRDEEIARTKCAELNADYKKSRLYTSDYFLVEEHIIE